MQKNVIVMGYYFCSCFCYKTITGILTKLSTLHGEKWRTGEIGKSVENSKTAYTNSLK